MNMGATKSQPKLGVCYYPEHWPEAQWPQDAAQMRALGLSWVRIGEFAWSRIEPKPNEFHWEWLDKAVSLLGDTGLSIIMGTPSATPPRWMVDKYPDMLALDKEGLPRGFGSRRHYCFSHAGYQEEAQRITQNMAERYGDNPSVQAWQTDNEYGCHDTVLSYSAHARNAFQKWLLARYKSIEALNTAWGNVFWSMEYDGFAQVELPNLTVTEANPAHVMDFRRFSSDQVVAFNQAQCGIIRQYSDAPIIHNYMGRITDFDHFAMGSDLDIASWDSYPLGFLEDRSDQGETFKHDYRRQGDPDFQAFHHDLYRAVGGMRSKNSRWWIMEQQPGPVNWAPYNPAPLPGMVRLWTWEAAAHGAEVISYFRWRQAPFGQEQMHSGLQRPDGVWSAGGREAMAAAKELSLLPDVITTPARIAIVFDYASAWAWDTQPQGQDFDYFRLVYDLYRGLRRLGFTIDILPASTDNFGDRAAVFIPGLWAWTDELRRALDSFSGQVMIGPRSGSKTQNFAIPTALPPKIHGFSCKVSGVESLRPGGAVALERGGHFQIWREFIESDETAVEKTSDGHKAIVSNGSVTYLAGWPDDVAMSRILTAFMRKAGLKPNPMTGGYRRRDFSGFTLHMNYGRETVVIPDAGRSIQLRTGDIAVINNTTQDWLVRPRRN